MILSGKMIRERIGKEIVIDPFDERKLNTNGYNLSLQNKLLIYENPILDMKSSNSITEVLIPEDGLVLHPGQLYLGSTVERTYTDKFMPIIEGRSSVARLGIFVHITAGLGEVGFNGNWTLELTCVQPVRIYPYVEICQIYFQEVVGEIELCHSNKYQNSIEPMPSKIYEELNGRGGINA